MKHLVCAVGLVLVSITSCTKVVDIDLPDHDSKLVINSLFTRGERININIGRSASINSGIPPGIYDSDINIYRESNLVESVRTSDSIYSTSFGPVENGNYSIEVSSPGFETVRASDSMPTKTVLSNLEYTDKEWVNDWGEEFKLLKLSFIDSDENHNYYEIKLLKRYLTKNYRTSEYYYRTERLGIDGTPDPILEEAWQYFNETGGLVFDDTKFNTMQCNLEIFIEVPNNGADEYEIIVELRSLSENYYNYKKQLGIYLKTVYEDILEGNSEPINLYSNIENGYGIFAGYMSDIQHFTIVR